MPDSEDQPQPARFAAALDAIRHASPRAELVVTEIAAPGNLAPFAVALSADVTPVRHGSNSDFGTGRFILLYDPEEPESWGGPFRVVCFAQAPLETDIGVDPFLAEVAWAWLVDALDSRGAAYTAASGTATKILSSGFGELAQQGDGAQIELRASWSPLDNDLAAHVEGWGELLCMLAGLPPAGETPGTQHHAHPSGSASPGHDHPEASGGIPVGPIDSIGPMSATGPRSGPGLHTLGVAAGGLDSGGMETVGTDTIGLNSLGTLRAGRETVGMNAVGISAVGISAVGISAVGMNAAETNTAGSHTMEPRFAAASEGGLSAGLATAPGLAAPTLSTMGVADRSAVTDLSAVTALSAVTDLSAHRAARA